MIPPNKDSKPERISKIVTWIKPNAEKFASGVLENFSVMKSNSPSQLKILSKPDCVITIPINAEMKEAMMCI